MEREERRGKAALFRAHRESLTTAPASAANKTERTVRSYDERDSRASAALVPIWQRTPKLPRAAVSAITTLGELAADEHYDAAQRRDLLAHYLKSEPHLSRPRARRLFEIEYECQGRYVGVPRGLTQEQLVDLARADGAATQWGVDWVVLGRRKRGRGPVGGTRRPISLRSMSARPPLPRAGAPRHPLRVQAQRGSRASGSGAAEPPRCSMNPELSTWHRAEARAFEYEEPDDDCESSDPELRDELLRLWNATRVRNDVLPATTAATVEPTTENPAHIDVVTPASTVEPSRLQPREASAASENAEGGEGGRQERAGVEAAAPIVTTEDGWDDLDPTPPPPAAITP